MEALFPLFLLLHVLGAIVAFGPSFAFPIIAAAGGAEPQHGNFALRVIEKVAKRVVWPLALFQGLTGLALIGAVRIDVFATPWLMLGIALYLSALAMSYLVATPNLRRLIELTSAPPPPGTSGPPPELVARIAASKRNGMIQSVLIVAIVLLMVVKPTF